MFDTVAGGKIQRYYIQYCRNSENQQLETVSLFRISAYRDPEAFG